MVAVQKNSHRCGQNREILSIVKFNADVSALNFIGVSNCSQSEQLLMRAATINFGWENCACYRHGQSRRAWTDRTVSNPDRSRSWSGSYSLGNTEATKSIMERHEQLLRVILADRFRCCSRMNNVFCTRSLPVKSCLSEWEPRHGSTLTVSGIVGWSFAGFDHISVLRSIGTFCAHAQNWMMSFSVEFPGRPPSEINN